MDQNLNEALNNLGMLATVTNARRDYLAERRLINFNQNSCSLSCLPPWRSGTSSGFPTKENQGLEKTFLYCASRRQSEKFYNRRPRSRCLPYDIRRKPFNGFNSSSSSSTSSSSSSSLSNSGISTPTRSGNFNFQIPTMSSHPLFSSTVHHLDELKTIKTDKFPVPVLFRSKSLESINDLRDRSRKEKEDLREVSSLCNNNSHSPQGLYNDMSNCIDFGIGINNGRGGFINLGTNNNTVNIKKEIDSMSMRIEKLDVA